MFAPSSAFCGSRVSFPDDKQKKAVALFDEGKFAEALPLFDALHQQQPSSKLLNYYVGACLIETKDYGQEAVDVLTQALEKDSPAMIYYYLGVALHADDEFKKAQNYYMQFGSKANSKVLKSSDYLKLKDLAQQEVNPFVPAAAPTQSPVSVVVPTTEPVVPVEPVQSAAKVVFALPADLKDTIISFQLTPEIQYLKVSQFHDAKAQEMYADALQKQKELSVAVRKTDELRNKYAVAADAEKQGLADQILQNEQRILALNNEIPTQLMALSELEAKYWQTAPASDLEKLTAENKSIRDSLQAAIAAKAPVTSEQYVVRDAAALVPIVEKPKTEAEPQVPQGIIYKVQIGAYRSNPPESVARLYKKLSLIRKISSYKDENGVNVYTVGELRSYDAAVELQKQVKQEGVKVPVVVAYQNGKRMKLEDARKQSK